MQNNNLNVTRKEESSLFVTLSFIIPSNNIVAYAYSSLQEVIERYSICEENVKDIHFTKIEENGNEMISVTIKYCKINTRELKSLDKVERIKTVLKYMGYTDENIKSVDYKKYWSNSNELVWVARVCDPDYDFAPDESYSARGYEMSIQNAIDEVLDFRVIIDLI